MLARLRLWISKANPFGRKCQILHGENYEVAFNPLGLLQWIWDGAGTIMKVNDTATDPTDPSTYPWLTNNDSSEVYGRYDERYQLYESSYLMPFSSPNLTAGVNWLIDRGLSIDYMITYALPKLMEDLGDLFGSVEDISSGFDKSMIINLVAAIENYFAYVPGTLDPDNYNSDLYTHMQENITMNKQRGAEIIFNLLTDLMNGLEINPMKAVSGILDEIMPLIQSMTSATSSGSG
ncbi:MAG: hypothetical protein ACTSRB_04545, partial [Candidatus Helarchaeota archaeon]